MGADFKDKTKKSFEKSWDKAAVRANTPDLFRRSADVAPTRLEAEAIKGANVAVGESACLRVEGGKLIGRKGISPVLAIAGPSQDLIQSIAEGGGVAEAEVVAADPISGVLEVVIR